METLGKLGFVYDLKNIAPNGEVIDDLHFHNLMPDEGVRWALTKVFLPDELTPAWSHRTSSDVAYREYNNLYVNFFKGLFQMDKKFDSMATFSQKANELNTEDAYLGHRTVITYHNSGYGDWEASMLDTTTNTLRFRKFDIFNFTHPVMLTGIFICACNESMEINTQYGLLVSEAFFPKPVFVEQGGKITVQCGCTLISV